MAAASPANSLKPKLGLVRVLFFLSQLAKRMGQGVYIARAGLARVFFDNDEGRAVRRASRPTRGIGHSIQLLPQCPGMGIMPSPYGEPRDGPTSCMPCSGRKPRGPETLNSIGAGL